MAALPGYSLLRLSIPCDAFDGGHALPAANFCGLGAARISHGRSYDQQAAGVNDGQFGIEVRLRIVGQMLGDSLGIPWGIDHDDAVL